MSGAGKMGAVRARIRSSNRLLYYYPHHQPRAPPFACHKINKIARLAGVKMSPVPPILALPPDLQNQESYHPSSPHLEEPLLAPRPHKLMPDLPAEVGSTTSRHPGFYL